MAFKMLSMNLAICYYGKGFCLPKFLNTPFEINVNIALWLTSVIRAFKSQLSLVEEGRLFDKYFPNSEL